MSSVVGTFGFVVAAALYVALTALLAVSWRGRLAGGLLIASTVATAVWALVMAMEPYVVAVRLPAVVIAEFIRSGGWLLFLSLLIRTAGLRVLTASAWAVWIGALVVTGAGLFLPWVAAEIDFVQAFMMSGLLSSLLVLVFIEQVYRYTAPEGGRGKIQYFVIGLALIFVFDLFVYSEGLLLGGVENVAWAARGYVAAFACPLLALSARHQTEWSVEVYVSRRATFYGTAITAIGIYLMLMAAVGYVIRFYGGEWGALAQLLFVAGAAVLLAVLLLSPRVRRELKVFLNKHFYRSRYDYRREWLQFAETLSAPRTKDDLHAAAIRSVARIVNCTRGSLWIEDDKNEAYECACSWPDDVEATTRRITKAEPLVAFIQRTKWILDLEQHRIEPDLYDDVPLPDGLQDGSVRLVVPLFLKNELLGLVALAGDGVPTKLNYEDHDLLKTVGSQVATYLRQDQIQRRLLIAQQFEAYHRLSAFMVHDLKNVIAQQDLVLQNAARFKTNPVFVDDALTTIANSVERMRRMLDQFRTTTESARRRVSLKELLGLAVRQCERHQPLPKLQADGLDAFVVCDPDRLAAAFAHLIRNGQQATTPAGSVLIDAMAMNGTARVSITDDGAGMDAQFVRDRLFSPFYTTKGSQGMGIGAYQARETILAIGGKLSVESTPGKGTTMRIELPAFIAEVPLVAEAAR